MTRKDTGISKVADLKGKRVAVTRGTDPHIFLVRALAEAGLTEKDITVVPLQHPDGRAALERGDVDAWSGLDPMMAAAEINSGAILFYRKPEANTWGILNVRESFAAEHPDAVKRVIAAYEEARAWALAHPDYLKKLFVAVHKSPRSCCRAPAWFEDRSVKQRNWRTPAAVHPGGRARAAASWRYSGNCGCERRRR